MFKKLKLYVLEKISRDIQEYEITMEELKERQLNGAVIVDVRSAQEYEEGHLDGSINIPYYDIDENVNRLLKNKEQEIILYCEIGSRSKKAYKRLKKLNYKNVYNLYGGIQNWL